MTEMTCRHCAATTSNGLALCDLCQRKVTTILEFLPIYFRNLARWRPGRAGSRPVPGSRVLYDGEVHGGQDRIGTALNEVGNDLTTWARWLGDDRDIETPVADGEAEQAAAISAHLIEHLTSIATLDWCGALVTALSEHEERLRGLTETSVPGWYAGSCRRRVSMESACGAPTFVVPGLTWVTCGACGTTTYARDHLDTILEEARPWVAPPMRLAEAACALVDTELSVPRLYERIKKWGQRDKITSSRRLDRDGDPAGPRCYRFGDVLDRLFSEGATRLDEMPTEVA